YGAMRLLLASLLPTTMRKLMCTSPSSLFLSSAIGCQAAERRARPSRSSQWNGQSRHLSRFLLKFSLIPCIPRLDRSLQEAFFLGVSMTASPVLGSSGCVGLLGDDGDRTQ